MFSAKITIFFLFRSRCSKKSFTFAIVNNSRRPFAGFALLLLLMLFLFMGDLFMGSVSIPFGDVAAALTGGATKASWRYIVVESRLPQALTALLCGSALGATGLMLQTAFRNPLAGPSIFGINSGAGLGVAIVMLLMGGQVSLSGFSAGGYVAVLLAAFAGALAVTAIILLFSTLVRSNTMLLIVGIMVGYVASSAISLLNYSATEEGVRSYMVWGMGNFSGVTLSQMPVFALLTVLGLAAGVLMVKPLNIFMLGPEYAESMGVNTLRLRNLLLLATALLTAVATAFCGPVAFLGLAVPHLARLLLRTADHRLLMPATMLMGAVVALLCNWLCALPQGGSVLPLNAVTPLVGAPVIIYVIARRA